MNAMLSGSERITCDWCFEDFAPEDMEPNPDSLWQGLCRWCAEMGRDAWRHTV